MPHDPAPTRVPGAPDAAPLTPESDATLHDATAHDPTLHDATARLATAAVTTGATVGAVTTGATAGPFAPYAARPLPARIGPYDIVRVLGEGGMGVVYEAEQTAPLRRRVALKVVRTELASREVLARFDAERQALAVMTHEAIAKVLDAGTDAGGAPYFVMELVAGVPITEYCDANRLGTRERLALFVTVCRAVQHAHQKGVIHRDLKPSNVLVADADAGPAPKVIDFGIAKAVAQPLDGRTGVTVYGQAVGTPAYMSPEQADGAALDVDTRTDVYSLGVLLYELLVGRLPADPRDIGALNFLARLVARTTDPPIPSAQVETLAADATVLQAVAERRRTDPAGLRRQLRGDLDWIVMRAIAPERDQRYATANALAMDLLRHLADEPVQARAPTAGYRVRKFVRRHRAGVLAAALALVAVVGGAVAATAGLVRARRAEARARDEAAAAAQVSAFLTGLFRVSDPSRARGNALTARALLDSGARKIETDLAAQPLVQARLTQTIGDVYAALGLYPEAERLLSRALATRTRLLPATATETGDNLTSLGVVYVAEGRYPLAESTLLRARRITDRAPGIGGIRTLSALSNLYLQEGRYRAADSAVRRAMTVLDSAGAPSGDVLVAERARELGNALNNLAISQAEQGRPAAAESLFRRVLAVRLRATGPDHPAVGKALGNLGNSLIEQGRAAAAESLYRRALAIDTRIYGPAHASVALDLYNLGNARSEQHDLAGAIGLFARAESIFVRVLGPDHPYVAAAMNARASSYGTQGHYAEAVPLLERALAQRERTLAPEHPFIATSHHELGVALTHLGRYAEAERHLQHALALRRRTLDPTSYYTAVSLAALADLRLAQADTAAALPLYAQALAQWTAAKRDTDSERAVVARTYARVLRARGRAAEAVAVERVPAASP